MAIDRADAIAQVTAPGQPFETGVEAIRGERFTVFAHAPRNLRELYRQGLAHADADFYIYEDTRLTFGGIWQQAARVANALAERGIAPGERVGIAARNYPEWIVAFMGITSMGGVAVALNAWWTGEELVYGIEDSGLKLLFTDIERTERLLPHLGALDIEMVTIRHRQDDLPTWDEFLAGAAETMPEPAIAPEDNATILYTSGSTAHPKGVLSTHRAITNALLGWECGGARGHGHEPGNGAANGGKPVAVPAVHDPLRAALPRHRPRRAGALRIPPGPQAGGHVQVGRLRSHAHHRGGTHHRLQRRADHGGGTGTGAGSGPIRPVEPQERRRWRRADGAGTVRGRWRRPSARAQPAPAGA